MLLNVLYQYCHEHEAQNMATILPDVCAREKLQERRIRGF
jgi:hypothetical protein